MARTKVMGILVLLVGVWSGACRGAASPEEPAGETPTPSPGLSLDPLVDGDIAQGEALAASILSAFRAGGRETISSYLMSEAELAAVGKRPGTRDRYVEKTEAMLRQAVESGLGRLSMVRKERRATATLRYEVLETKVGSYEFRLIKISGQWRIYPS